MKILHVNQHDTYGGAARIAALLHQGMLKRGNQSLLVVGDKRGGLQYTRELEDLSPSDTLFGKFVWKLRAPFKSRMGKRGTGIALKSLSILASPYTEFKRWQGFEVFNYPGTKKIIAGNIDKPDLIHLHNLHNNFFDLRFITELSQTIPTLFTLHDEWLYTGHCAYTLGCVRWKTGCGDCPDLSIYPAIRKDQTKYNLEQKREIYKECKLNIVSPSHWLLDRAETSILSKGIINRRVIANGVDQTIFKPFDQIAARKLLNIPLDVKMVFFQTARHPTENKFKDFETLRKAINRILKSDSHKDIIIIGAGCEYLQSLFPHNQVRSAGYIYDQQMMAKYFQSADVFLHAAHSEVFGLVIAESLSCGTPVIATNIGGIPELVFHGINGYLVKEGDFTNMAFLAKKILNNAELRRHLGNQAIQSSHPSFGVNRMLDEYEIFYREILADWKDRQNK